MCSSSLSLCGVWCVGLSVTVRRNTSNRIQMLDLTRRQPSPLTFRRCVSHDVTSAAHRPLTSDPLCVCVQVTHNQENVFDLQCVEESESVPHDKDDVFRQLTFNLKRLVDERDQHAEVIHTHTHTHSRCCCDE